jgi:serine/threonine-protein kinase RsbW
VSGTEVPGQTPVVVTQDRDEWTGQAQPAVVRTLRHAVTSFAARAGVSGRALDDVRACVSEAVTNAIVHAFRDGRIPGTVTVRAESHDHELVIVVIDDGLGFGPRADSPGLGLGLATITALTDTMSVEAAASGGTALRMTFARTNPRNAAQAAQGRTALAEPSP